MSDEERRAYVHIYAPPGEYFGAVRRAGCRNYETVVKPSKSFERVLAATSKAFASKKYKRAVVAFSAEYHDPIAIVTMVLC